MIMFDSTPPWVDVRKGDLSVMSAQRLRDFVEWVAGKKGDVMFWHPMLIHGGCAHLDSKRHENQLSCPSLLMGATSVGA